MLKKGNDFSEVNTQCIIRSQLINIYFEKTDITLLIFDSFTVLSLIGNTSFYSMLHLLCLFFLAAGGNESQNGLRKMMKDAYDLMDCVC